MDEVNVSVIEVIVMEEDTNQNGRPLAHTKVENKKRAKQRALVIYFLLRAHDSYDDYRKESRNSILNGRDEYPTQVGAAFEIKERHGPAIISGSRVCTSNGWQHWKFRQNENNQPTGPTLRTDMAISVVLVAFRWGTSPIRVQINSSKEPPRLRPASTFLGPVYSLTVNQPYINSAMQTCWAASTGLPE
jgi:hypothetical protein